jgi:hypothetical protein
MYADDIVGVRVIVWRAPEDPVAYFLFMDHLSGVIKDPLAEIKKHAVEPS